MTKVHDWIDGEGQQVGCGTAAELRHWKREGVVEADVKLGAVIGHEPAFMDQNRKALWA